MEKLNLPVLGNHTTVAKVHTMQHFGPCFNRPDNFAIGIALCVPQTLLAAELVHAAEGEPYMTADYMWQESVPDEQRPVERWEHEDGCHERILSMDNWHKTVIKGRADARYLGDGNIRVDCIMHPEFWMELRHAPQGWQVSGGRHVVPASLSQMGYRAPYATKRAMGLPRWVVEDTGDVLIVRDSNQEKFYLKLALPSHTTRNKDKRRKLK